MKEKRRMKNYKSIINTILYKINLRVLRPFPKEFQKYNLMDKKDLIGVEIGVYKGDNALSLLKRSSIKKLYLIDPYEFFNDNVHGRKEIGEAGKIAKHKLKQWDNVVWIKKKSEDAVSNIPNDLDFVYIDGDHFYEGVKKDIENYYPKLKKGGILAGDDFQDGTGRDSKKEVIKAVMEFVNKEKLKLHVIESLGVDWWVIKK